MPVELKELIVKATVSPQPSPKTEEMGAQAGQEAERDRQALIQDCIDAVLEIIKEKYGR